MTTLQPTISLSDWDMRYANLQASGLREPAYGGPLRRHVDDGDHRLSALRFDPSPAALRLWNFLLTEEDRLRAVRAEGKLLLGAMKDLGTIPVLAQGVSNLTAFYPDGAWWIPCIMQNSDRLLHAADRLGLDESFCPVRAMVGAFENGEHFPIPDLLTCSVGAVCDDFSAIAQRIEAMGQRIVWWDVPHRRDPEHGEPAVELPGGFTAPQSQVHYVRSQLQAVRTELETLCGETITSEALRDAIRRVNAFRRELQSLRRAVYSFQRCPLPGLEMLIVEMLAIHFCSDLPEAHHVVRELQAEVQSRLAAGVGTLPAEAVRIFWVNPVADLRAMNLLEAVGGRICGTEYLFPHALDPIPEEIEPMEALARMVLADPMVGPSRDRALRICRDALDFQAEAVVVSRIPGASHCAVEGGVIARYVREQLNLPVVEIEVPCICDSILPSLQSRLEAVIEIAKERRKK